MIHVLLKSAYMEEETDNKDSESYEKTEKEKE